MNQNVENEKSQSVRELRNSSQRNGARNVPLQSFGRFLCCASVTHTRPLLQDMVESQSRRINDLMERVRLQQDKLDKQNVRIRTLQSQVSTQASTHTAAFAFVSFPWQPGFHPSQIQQPRQRSSFPGRSSTEDPLQGGAAEQHDTPVGEYRSSRVKDLLLTLMQVDWTQSDAKCGEPSAGCGHKEA